MPTPGVMRIINMSHDARGFCNEPAPPVRPMTTQPRPMRWRLLGGALCSSLVLAMAACQPAPDVAQNVASTAGAGAAPAASPGFKVAALPVSQAPLGPFPYLDLPAGFVRQEEVQGGFDRVPFWTGDRVEWVDGTVYSTMIHSDGAHPYSQLALSRHVQERVESLGGQRIFSGTLPAEASGAIGNSKAAVTYVGGLGDIYNAPAQTFVIHRADRDIWVHLGESGDAAGLLVVETRPVQVTGGGRPVDALKQGLGRG